MGAGGRRALLYSARGYRRGATQRSPPWAAAPAPSVTGLVRVSAQAGGVGGGGKGATRAQAGGAGGRRTPGSLMIGRVGPDPCDGDVTRGVRVHPELLPREIRVVGAEAQQPPSRLGGAALPSGKHALLAEHLRRCHRLVGLPCAVVAEQREYKLRELILVVVVRRRLRARAGTERRLGQGQVETCELGGVPICLCAPLPLLVVIPPCRSRGRPTDYRGPGAAAS